MEEIISNEGWRVKLIRPLDFIVIADHAENLGLADFTICVDEDMTKTR